MQEAQGDDESSQEVLQESANFQKLVYLAIFIVFFLANWHHMSGFQMMNDEAAVVCGTQHISRGEYPYYDWTTRSFPGAFIFCYPFQKLLGFDQFGTRMTMLILASLQGLVVYWLSREIPKQYRLIPWLLWTLLGLQEFPILGYRWCSVFWYTLLTTAVLRWVQCQGQQWSRRVGLIFAIAAMQLQTEAFAATCFIAVAWLLWRPANLTRLFLVATILSLLLWLPFAPAWRIVLQESVTELSDHSAFNRHPYSISDLRPFIDNALNQPAMQDPLPYYLNWLSAGIYLFKFGLLWVFPLTGAALYLRKKPTHWGVLSLAMLFILLANFNRLTIGYAAYLLPLWSILAVRQLGKANYLVVLLASTYWLGTAEFRRETRIYSIKTPSGVYWTSNYQESLVYQKLGEWALRIQSETSDQSNQLVVTFPFLPCTYSLFGARNALRDDFIIPISYSQAKIETSLSNLNRTKPGWLIFAPLNPAETNIDVTRYLKAESELREKMTRNYTEVDSYMGLKLYRLNAPK